MATTYNDNGGATPNGSNLNFTYTFPILKTEDVKVALNGVTQATTKYSVNVGVNPTRIEFNNTSVDATVQESSGAPKTGVTVRVYRDTDVDTAKAVYAAGSSIRAQNLNDNQEQVLYALQEEQNQLILAERFADGSITSAKILDGTIVNADVNASAAIEGSKLQASSGSNAGSMSSANFTKLAGIEASATADQTDAEIRAAVEAATDSNVFTDADHSKLNAIEASATADQTAAEIRTAVEAASDSNVFTDDDHSKLDGIAASANNYSISADLLDEDDFATNSATKVPSQQSTKAYIAATSQPLDGDLTTLAGMQAGTASILASGTALTSTTAELNLLDGKSIVTSVSGSSTDVQLPSAKAVNDHIVATLQGVGGFYPIDDKAKFPNTNPDPNDDAGTIVSIADAGGIVVNGSGVSTSAETLGGTTVTINGIDSTLNGTTIAAGKGMLVQTTSTLNTYDYHRLVLDEGGVASAQTLVSDFNARYRILANGTNINTVGSLDDGDLLWDSNVDKMKVYNSTTSSWNEVTSIGDYKLLTVVDAGQTSGTPTWTNTTFDLRDGSSAASVTSAGQLIISVNGVIQKPNAGTSAPTEGFALVDANTIIFGAAPGANASVFVTLIGSATTVNVPATNSIVEAAIQSNVVSEEKLKISNSPTNGQFLSAQSGNSGGLTWATVSSTPEGEAILSTTNSNEANTKFLRADGDGTCSWQIPTDTNTTYSVQDGQLSENNFTDADHTKLDGIATGATAVGGATGVNFNDNVAATWGTNSDELKILYDTTTGVIQNKGGSGGVEIRHSADDGGTVETAAKFLPDGAAELYYDNAKKLETVTGGATITGACTATSFAGDGSALTGIPTRTQPFRNLIINGAMQIAQRGTSATSNGYKTVDRFSHFSGQGTTTWSQLSETSGIATHGCRYALRCTNTSNSTAANAYREITYKIENQDLMQSGWDYTSASSKLTLSFWVRASVAQTYYGRIRWMGDSADKNFVFSTGSLTANTWTKVTVAIPGLSGKTLHDGGSSGNNASIWQINWSPFQGTDGTASGTALNTWNAYAGGSKYPDYATTWAGTDGATFDITAVQLELGDTATDFEHRSYGDQLVRSQRYYYKSDMFYSSCMTYTPGSGDHNFSKMNTDHPVTMRTNPAGVAGDFAVWSWSSATGVAAANLTWSFDNGTNNSMMTMAASHSNAAAPANGPGSGHMMPCRVLNIEFDAEI